MSEGKPEVTFEDFHRICRLCFCQDENLQSLFGLNYHLILNKIARLKIFLGDGYPERICYECCKNIRQVAFFVQKCKESELKLRDIVRKRDVDDKSRIIIPQPATPLPPEPEVVFTSSDNESDREADVPEPIDPDFVKKHFGESEGETEEDHKIDIKEEVFSHFGEAEANLMVEGNKTTPTGMYVCHVCSNQFKYQSNLRRHIKIHENPCRYICELCGKAFTASSSLAVHKKSYHARNNFYKCADCTSHFSSFIKFSTHQQSNDHHFFKCNECLAICEDKPSLKTHLVEHGSEIEDKYSCTRCEEQFYFSVDLDEHTDEIHSQHFPCPYCPKTFKETTTLKLHLKSHTSVRPHTCSECSQNFRLRSHLKSHVKLIHQGGANVKCRYCEKKFTTKGTLVVHERIHTGVTPYKCHVCGASYRVSSNRRRHVRRRHGEEEVLRIAEFDKSLAMSVQG